MKIKLFLAAVIMAIAMTACTSDEVVLTPETAETPISFNAVTSNMTRAGYTFCQNDQPLGFWVGAYQGNKNYFNSAEGYLSSWDNITWDPEYSVWKSSTKRYWPKYGTLNFYALLDGAKDSCPNFEVKSRSDNSDVIVTITNYSINNDLSKQTDLMYAITKDASVANSSAVTLNFLHALSQICFEAEREDKNSTFEITDIVVSGVKKTGTFTLYNSSTDKGTIDHYGSTSNTITHQGYWDSQAGSESYTISLSNTIPSDLSEDDKKYFRCILDDTSDNTCNISNPNKYTDHNPNGSNSNNYTVHKNRVMNLMPQTLPDDAKITVWFNVNGNESDQKSAELSISGTWEMGKRYIYTLKFTKGAEISYTTTIADFDNATPTDMEL